MRFHLRPRFSLFVATALVCVDGFGLRRREELLVSGGPRLDQGGRVGAQVDNLADETLEGREAGTRGGRAAGDYLAEQYARLHLRGAGVQAASSSLSRPITATCWRSSQGSDPKLRDQVIVVGAHYDHIGYGGAA